LTAAEQANHAVAVEANLHGLLEAQRALRSRFDDFRQALSRRDEPAYRFGLEDFLQNLTRWSEAEEAALLPAILRAGVAGRDPRRELHLEWVQLRELTRILLSLVAERDKLSDTLGITENLARRLAAHESDLERVYFPAAATELTPEEWNLLSEAAPE
jgi:hypothetical protein